MNKAGSGYYSPFPPSQPTGNPLVEAYNWAAPRISSTLSQLAAPEAWKSLGSYPPITQYENAPQRDPQELRDISLGVAMDWNPLSAGLAGIVKNVGRGYEKGTWEMAFTHPRELGSHVAVDPALYEEFKKYRQREGKKAAVEKFKIDLNPLETIDPGTYWTPWNTIKSLRQKGMDKLSKSTQNKLNDIAKEYLKEKEALLPYGVRPSGYENLIEELDVKYNKKIRSLLKKEGYDSIKYDAVEVTEGAIPKAKTAESFILLDDPLKAPFTTKTTDVPDLDSMIKNPDYFFKNKGISHQVVYMSPDQYIEEAAKGFTFMNRKMRKEFIRDTEGKAALARKRKAEVENNPALVVSKEELAKSRENIASEEYTDDMMRGDVFPMGVLDYSGDFGPFAQEGLHRAVAARNLNLPYIPVMRIGKVSKKKAGEVGPGVGKDYVIEEIVKEFRNKERQHLLRKKSPHTNKK